MARLSKICHSARCGGTKQRIELTMRPNPDRTSVTYVARCLACGETHPPDSSEVVADGRAWADRIRAANGGTIPTPLPATTSAEASAS